MRLATGSPGSAYHAYGVRLAARLKELGLTVELVQTRGSLENYQRPTKLNWETLQLDLQSSALTRLAEVELSQASPPCLRRSKDESLSLSIRVFVPLGLAVIKAASCSVS